MKIAICGSMSSSKKMVEVARKLEAAGHKVELPQDTIGIASGRMADNEPAQKKIEDDLIRRYYKEIRKNDALLVVNIDKNGVKNYIGGNAFLEMGFAFVLHKKLYLLNPIPDVPYRDEIEAMQPIVINK